MARGRRSFQQLGQWEDEIDMMSKYSVPSHLAGVGAGLDEHDTIQVGSGTSSPRDLAIFRVALLKRRFRDNQLSMSSRYESGLSASGSPPGKQSVTPLGPLGGGLTWVPTGRNNGNQLASLSGCHADMMGWREEEHAHSSFPGLCSHVSVVDISSGAWLGGNGARATKFSAGLYSTYPPVQLSTYNKRQSAPGRSTCLAGGDEVTSRVTCDQRSSFNQGPLRRVPIGN